MSSISVILNVYKRPYTLEAQIEAIKTQTIPVESKDIHVWYNTPEGEHQSIVLPKDKDIKTYFCNYNTKFFGRFTIPLLCKTDYIAIFDDDIIPGRLWFEHCLLNIVKRDGILGGSGVITNGKTYIPNTKVGWNGIKSETAQDVDLVGHAWFYKQQHAKFMWLESPPSWDNGEDMFFSYVAQKNGVPTYVPAHPKTSQDLWSNNPSISRTNGVDWGNDKNAHSLTVNNHLSLRNEIVIKLKSKGWKLING
jgi:hypothetical protein